MKDDRKPQTGKEAIKIVREKSPHTLIAFSTGKDAIGAMLAIREQFDSVTPFYMYTVPDLEFVEESLQYYERFFQTRIVRMPHDSLYRMMNNMVFQPPDRQTYIRNLDLPMPERDDIAYAVAFDMGLDPDITYTAVGVRKNDSITRRMAINKYGTVNHTKQIYYPIAEWSKQDLIAAIKHAGVKLSKDYQLFGRSFDGLDLRFTYQIKKHYPRDYQKILEWFPLVEVELYRYEFHTKGHQ